MSLEKDITGVKYLFEDVFKSATDEDLENRKTEEQKRREAERLKKEEEARIYRQGQLVIAREKYQKFLKVLDILGFTPDEPEPPTDNGWTVNLPRIYSKTKDGLRLALYVDTYRNSWDKVTVYADYISDSDDEDVRDLSNFSEDERDGLRINISTNKTAERIASDITRRLLPKMTASAEQMNVRVSAEVIQLKKKKKIIQDTVSALGLTGSAFDNEGDISTYLNGEIDRFELSPRYDGDKVDVKLSITAEAFPTLLKLIKKLG